MTNPELEKVVSRRRENYLQEADLIELLDGAPLGKMTRYLHARVEFRESRQVFKGCAQKHQHKHKGGRGGYHWGGPSAPGPGTYIDHYIYIYMFFCDVLDFSFKMYIAFMIFFPTFYYRCFSSRGSSARKSSKRQLHMQARAVGRFLSVCFGEWRVW